MYYKLIFLSLLVFLFFNVPPLTAQDKEPEFIGEAFLLDEQGSYTQLDKEMAAYTRGISFRENSFDALSLEITGGKAQTRISKEQPLTLIVRAADNNSDPLSIVRIYRLRAKKKKRTTVLSENNSGTLLKSRTHTKNQLSFTGKKYGTSSYLLSIKDIEAGEYGIVVTNPNNVDEKRVIVSCFGVD